MRRRTGDGGSSWAATDSVAATVDSATDRSPIQRDAMRTSITPPVSKAPGRHTNIDQLSQNDPVDGGCTFRRA